MTDKEILQKCVQQAKNNGFKLSELWILDNQESWLDFKEKIIFSHEFAKAFWGEELSIVDEVYDAEIVPRNDKSAPYCLNKDYVQSWKLEFPKWKMHLREMVLDKEPLKYLEKFIDNS